MTTDLQPPKNQDIQFLRGIAILMVLVQHYPHRLPTPDWVANLFIGTSFWTGVDLFFAISGFVIARSLLQHHRKGSTLTIYGLKEFWIKRVFRLLPSAWFWLAVSLALSPFFLTTALADPTLLAHSAFAAALAYSNIYWDYCVQNSLIGISCPTPDVNGQYWSLSAEEQFYIVLTIALLFIRTRQFLIVAIPLSFCVWLVPSISAWHWHMRYESLVLGVAIYWINRAPIYRGIARVLRFVWLRQAIILAMCACMALVGPSSMSIRLIFVAACAFFATLVATVDGAMTRGMVGKSNAWIGERAYSIYLCQWVVYLTIREVLMRAGAGPHWSSSMLFGFSAPMALATVIALGALSHRIIDVPATRYGKQIAKYHARNYRKVTDQA